MTTQPITNPSAKARFMASPDNITKHREMVDSREFERAIDFGLMQYQQRLAFTLADETNSNAAAAAALKMKGAMEFVTELRMLGEAPRPIPTPARGDNLNHNLS